MSISAVQSLPRRVLGCTRGLKAAGLGTALDRLTFKGFSSSVPTDTHATVEGRENNRRVEFAIEIAIVSPKGVAQ